MRDDLLFIKQIFCGMLVAIGIGTIGLAILIMLVMMLEAMGF